MASALNEVKQRLTTRMFGLILDNREGVEKGLQVIQQNNGLTNRDDIAPEVQERSQEIEEIRLQGRGVNDMLLSFRRDGSTKLKGNPTINQTPFTGAAPALADPTDNAVRNLNSFTPEIEDSNSYEIEDFSNRNTFMIDNLYEIEDLSTDQFDQDNLYLEFPFENPDQVINSQNLYDDLNQLIEISESNIYEIEDPSRQVEQSNLYDITDFSRPIDDSNLYQITKFSEGVDSSNLYEIEEFSSTVEDDNLYDVIDYSRQVSQQSLYDIRAFSDELDSENIYLNLSQFSSDLDPEQIYDEFNQDQTIELEKLHRSTEFSEPLEVDNLTPEQEYSTELDRDNIYQQQRSIQRARLSREKLFRSSNFNKDRLSGNVNDNSERKGPTEGDRVLGNVYGECDDGRKNIERKTNSALASDRVKRFFDQIQKRNG